AQTEPQKTKPLSTATPPAVSSQQVDKNPPPIDVKNMDTSVKPEDDFYLYANGNWIKNNPIPTEY
ncbi:MAG: hypothetical protein ACXWAV_05035, partial [Chthoniobacterales bacterium]